MQILILGGTGLIGGAVVRRLIADGHAVSGIARSAGAAQRRFPEIHWIEADLARLVAARDWAPMLKDVDAIVNCAGALQDGPRDDVTAVQATAMLALYAAAAERAPLVVQISARRDLGAPTPFLESKRRADTALAASGLPFVILRPAIVIGPHPYGGSALLRALAALPLAVPLPAVTAPLRFTPLSSVIDAVADAVAGRIAPGGDIALGGTVALPLDEAVMRHRAWLGLRPAPVIRLPSFTTRLVSALADAAGRLGWRSPLRSTAFAVLNETAPVAQNAMALGELDAALAAHPAGVADRWFARLYLLKPVVIATLALFWTLSGLIALIRFDASAAHLAAAGASPQLAIPLTLATSLLDLALGLGVLVQRAARPALLGMIAVSLTYLAGATLLAPALWADPLGPLLKVLPSIVLAAVALAILEER